jgi:hypothetical protein
VGLLERVLAEGAFVLVAAVVGGQAHDHVALLVGHQHVARAAVVRAACHHGGQLVVGRVGLVGECLCGLWRQCGARAHAQAEAADGTAVISGNRAA